MTLFEALFIVKAYALLATAVVGGESLEAAGPDYYEATCYLDGYDIHSCIDATRYAFVEGLFPMDMSDSEESNDG